MKMNEPLVQKQTRGQGDKGTRRRGVPAFTNVLVGIDHQAEISEIFVKGQAGHVIEQVRDYHERERTTVGEFFIL